MEKLTIVQNFESKFEDIRIFARTIEVDKIRELNSGIIDNKITAYSAIWHDTKVYVMTDSKNIVGKVFLILRNQGEDFNLAIHTSWEGAVYGPADKPSASTICKYIQFIFDWMKEYVRENNIVDNNGNPFLVPNFLYSAHHFEAEFPE